MVIRSSGQGTGDGLAAICWRRCRAIGFWGSSAIAFSYSATASWRSINHSKEDAMNLHPDSEVLTTKGRREKGNLCTLALFGALLAIALVSPCVAKSVAPLACDQQAIQSALASLSDTTVETRPYDSSFNSTTSGEVPNADGGTTPGIWLAPGRLSSPQQ